jgi:Lipocalin / cytosolic fatty-acid binding protein family
MIFYVKAPQRSNYIILSTDYDNYSIVYNCEVRDENAKEWFAVLSRSKVLSASVKEEVENFVDQHFDRKNSLFVIEEQGDK